ncbi:MAG: phosphate signaling complex protein PhoU [Acidimicrobiales bacterium]
MAGPLRKGFHGELADIDAGVVQLFALVIEGLGAATETLLSGDRETASKIKARDSVIDQLNVDLAEIVERTLLLQAPVAGELRFLLSVLRIVPELERSGDLAEHIAQRANLSLAADLTPSVRGMIELMGRLGVEMWRKAADAYSERDTTAAARIDAMDDELDELHDRVSESLLDEAIPRRAALEMALVARFYERLGDHAVHISERFVNLSSRV